MCTVAIWTNTVQDVVENMMLFVFLNPVPYMQLVIILFNEQLRFTHGEIMVVNEQI